MTKYYGSVGYCETTKTKSGVWKEEVVRKANYSGDVSTYHSRRWDRGEHLNDKLSVNATISIVADPYAFAHFHNIRFIEYMGTYWKVTNVEVRFPRLILSLGEVYNGETNPTTGTTGNSSS